MQYSISMSDNDKYNVIMYQYVFWFPCVNHLALSSFSNCCIGILQALRRFQAQLDVFYSSSGLFPVATCDERAHGHQLQHNYVNGIGWSLHFGIITPPCLMKHRCAGSLKCITSFSALMVTALL